MKLKMVKLEESVVKMRELDCQIWQYSHGLTSDIVIWKILELGRVSLNLGFKNIIVGTLNNNNL